MVCTVVREREREEKTVIIKLAAILTLHVALSCPTHQHVAIKIPEINQARPRKALSNTFLLQAHTPSPLIPSV